MPAPAITKASVTNAIRAVQERGIDIAEIIVSRDGTVRIIAKGTTKPLGSASQQVDAWDKATGTTTAPQDADAA